MYNRVSPYSSPSRSSYDLRALSCIANDPDKSWEQQQVWYSTFIQHYTYLGGRWRVIEGLDLPTNMTKIHFLS